MSLFKNKKQWIDLAALLAASVLYGIAYDMLLLPHAVVMGGATGISAILHILFHTPTGAVIFAINLPLIAFSVAKTRGKIFHAVAAIVTTSATIDIFAFLPSATGDAFVGAIFGGLVMGAGAGILVSFGYTTGGSDLAAVLIHDRAKHLSAGHILLIIDGIIIVSGALITKRFEGILYSLVTTYAYSTAMDFVISGASSGKLAYVFSKKSDEVAAAVSRETGRGVTMLHGKGWYMNEEQQIVMCVVRRRELFALRNAVHTVDPDAFITISDASEVIGKGFSVEEKELPLPPEGSPAAILLSDQRTEK